MAKRATKKRAGTAGRAGASRTRKPQKKLSDLFHETLKDIYFAENKIIKTLPKMAKAAQSRDLAAAFNKHLRETQGQVKRLDQVFRIIGKPARGKPCDAINGITDEGAEIMKDYKGTPGARCRPACGRAGGRALRDLPLRHACAPGPRSSACRMPQAAPGDA